MEQNAEKTKEQRNALREAVLAEVIQNLAKLEDRAKEEQQRRWSQPVSEAEQALIERHKAPF